MPFRILQASKKCTGNCPDCPNKRQKQEAPPPPCDDIPHALFVREESELFIARREEFAI